MFFFFLRKKSFQVSKLVIFNFFIFLLENLFGKAENFSQVKATYIFQVKFGEMLPYQHERFMYSSKTNPRPN